MMETLKVFEFIFMIIGLINTGLYWKIMERVSRIEENHKGEIRRLNENQTELKQELFEFRKDIKELTKAIAELNISIAKK